MSNVTRQKKLSSLPGERWKKIETPRPTLKMEYYVSNKGRIKSKSKIDGSEHSLNPTPDKKEYLKSSIKLEGGSYGLYVHMQVAKYWAKKPKNKNATKFIHKDLNRLNNSAENIVWVTNEEWKEYIRARATKYGFTPHRKGGKPKLTEAKVKKIKEHLVKGKMPKSKIAAKFDVSHTQVNRIESGENWGHVEVPGFIANSNKMKSDTKKKAAKKTTAKKATAKKATAKKATAKKATAKKVTAKKTTAKKAAPKKAAAKKAAPKKATAKKVTAKKTTAKKAAPKKATAKKAAPKKATAKKATAKKTTAKKAAPKKATAKKAAPKKATAKKATAKKATAKKAAPKKATAKKATAKKTTAKKATAKKTTAKKATARKAAPKKATAKKAAPKRVAKKTTARKKK